VAFTGSNDYITGLRPVKTPNGPEICAMRFTLAVTTGDLALNTIGQIGVLPAGCIPVDVMVDATDVDTGAAALVMQVGIWDGSGANISVVAADGGAHWGVTAAANAAFVQRLTTNGNAMATVTATNADRKLGIKVTTAPTTPAAGTLGVTLLYRYAG
jgi:hypothetical protein